MKLAIAFLFGLSVFAAACTQTQPSPTPLVSTVTASPTSKIQDTTTPTVKIRDTATPTTGVTSSSTSTNTATPTLTLSTTPSQTPSITPTRKPTKTPVPITRPPTTSAPPKSPVPEGTKVPINEIVVNNFANRIIGFSEIDKETLINDLKFITPYISRYVQEFSATDLPARWVGDQKIVQLCFCKFAWVYPKRERMPCIR